MKDLLLASCAAFAVFFLIINPAMAESEKIPEFSEVDTNQDGMINRDEASQVPEIANLYNGADLDQDGNLDSNEYDRAKTHLERKS